MFYCYFILTGCIGIIDAIWIYLLSCVCYQLFRNALLTWRELFYATATISTMDFALVLPTLCASKSKLSSILWKKPNVLFAFAWQDSRFLLSSLRWSMKGWLKRFFLNDRRCGFMWVKTLLTKAICQFLGCITMELLILRTPFLLHPDFKCELVECQSDAHCSSLWCQDVKCLKFYWKNTDLMTIPASRGKQLFFFSNETCG